ncbi:hypothetical protein HMPREF3147_08780 [Corynebacterium sp. HMSC05D03]|nr:hypothetical protein HMPREF2781_06950 [Corynebacterium sp. HMSC062A03]OFP24978.1 hypothetical protein HMPREF2996_10055 [Corynebacterium sp. HMSC066C02]OFQ37069.1 hypothetical protein HMPREF2943_08205 [Corynebacterium sp. HMSC072D12]OFT65121.1 hypothetical protein HMPREF3147_08780 [Corynebacterium sp. HMSC05D03]
MGTAGEFFTLCLRHLPGKGWFINSFFALVFLLTPAIANDHSDPGEGEGDGHDKGGGDPPLPDINHGPGYQEGWNAQKLQYGVDDLAAMPVLTGGEFCRGDEVRFAPESASAPLPRSWGMAGVIARVRRGHAYQRSWRTRQLRY